MLNLYDLALLRTNQSRRMVTIAELLLRTVLACQLLNQLWTRSSLCVHGHQRLHAVAAVYIQHLSHRTETVSGIHIPTVCAIILQTPILPI